MSVDTIVQVHASTDPEALEIAKLAVVYNNSGLNVKTSIEKAFTILNESRKFAVQLQQQRMQQLNEQGEKL